MFANGSCFRRGPVRVISWILYRCSRLLSFKFQIISLDFARTTSRKRQGLRLLKEPCSSPLWVILQTFPAGPATSARSLETGSPE